jgi:hypothetical protein
VEVVVWLEEVDVWLELEVPDGEVFCAIIQTDNSSTAAVNKLSLLIEFSLG